MSESFRYDAFSIIMGRALRQMEVHSEASLHLGLLWIQQRLHVMLMMVFNPRIQKKSVQYGQS